MLVGGGAIAPEWRRSSVATRAYPIGAAHAMTSTVSRRQGCGLRSVTRAVPAVVILTHSAPPGPARGVNGWCCATEGRQLRRRYGNQFRLSLPAGLGS